MSNPPSARVLVADDQDDVLEALRLLLKTEGFQTIMATSPSEVETLVAEQELDVALIDLNYTRDTTSGREGLDLIARLRTIDPMLPVVVMTAWGSVASAVEAMQRGARDYVQKPWENARLLATLRTQLELARTLRQNRKLADESARQRLEALPKLIAASPAMQPVLSLIARIGPSDASVLITGEHGTGKEVVARWLHDASLRKAQPFVPVNAGGVAEGVFDSELFGHVKGAFTDAKSDRMGCFELADGGTLFLDEIANMPMAQQAKLLRVLQTGELHPVGSVRPRHVNARVLAATNADLGKLVRAGLFREDLLYRLNTVEIALPPLRERREDIAPLASYYLAQHATRYGKAVQTFTKAATQALVGHGWPGNVRELTHVVERAVLMAQGAVIDVEDLGLGRSHDSRDRVEDLTLEAVEKMAIEKALARFQGNTNEAARALGLSRSALYRRLQAFGLKGSG